MTLLQKRIPVSKDVHKQLHILKEPGTTYNELLKSMIQERNQKELAERMDQLEKMDDSELVSLDDI